MVILYFWQFLSFCFQVGWHHYVIHLLPPQKLCIDEFVKEVAITLLFIKMVAWLSLNPWIKYPKIINSDFFWPFHHYKKSSSFFYGLFWAKTRKRKKKKERNHRLNPLWKKSKDNCHTSKCSGVMSPHRKKHQTHFLFILLSCFYCAFTARRMACTAVINPCSPTPINIKNPTKISSCNM